MCTPATLHFARALRRDATDAERLLWYHLRDRRLAGVEFGRQHPVGPFVADFLSLEAGIIVEGDGSRHAASTEAGRTTFLERRGFRVLRFWNHDVLVRTETVLAVIHAAVTSSGPHPDPVFRRTPDDVRAASPCCAPPGDSCSAGKAEVLPHRETRWVEDFPRSHRAFPDD